MKRLPLVALLVVLTAMSLADADPRFRAEGLVSYPNPASRIYGGVTEILNPCGEPNADLREHNGGNVNGHDGWWIKLPADAPGREAHLIFNHDTSNDVADLDMDAWFYNETCTLITDDDDENAYSMADTPTTITATGGPPETGRIPAKAAWVVVNLIVGSDTVFRFDVL